MYLLQNLFYAQSLVERSRIARHLLLAWAELMEAGNSGDAYCICLLEAHGLLLRSVQHASDAGPAIGAATRFCITLPSFVKTVRAMTNAPHEFHAGRCFMLVPTAGFELAT